MNGRKRRYSGEQTPAPEPDGRERHISTFRYGQKIEGQACFWADATLMKVGRPDESDGSLTMCNYRQRRGGPPSPRVDGEHTVQFGGVDEAAYTHRYQISHIRHTDRLYRNDIYEKPPFENDAWVEINLRPNKVFFSTSSDVFKVRLRIHAVYAQQRATNSVLEGSVVFRIPGIQEGSIFHDMKFVLTCWLQSHCRADEESPFAFGPDTTIRHLELRLQKDLSLFPAGFEHLPHDNNSVQRVELRKRLVAAAANIEIAPLKIYTNGCICGNRVNCSFCKGPAPAYERVDPLAARSEPTAPYYETIDADVRMDDNRWNPHGTPPDYVETPLSELERQWQDIKLLLGCDPDWCNIVSLDENLTQCHILQEQWQKAKDEAASSPDPGRASQRMQQAEHEYKTSDALSDAAAFIAGLWQVMAEDEKIIRFPRWDIEREQLKTMATHFVQILTRINTKDLITLARSAGLMLIDMTQIVEVGKLPIRPDNYDMIRTQRVTFQRLSKSTIGIIEQLHKAKGEGMVENTSQRILGIPGREPIKYTIAPGNSADCSVELLQDLFSKVTHSRLCLKHKHGSGLMIRMSCALLQADASAILTLLNDLNNYASGPYRMALQKNAQYVLLAHQSTIETVREVLASVSWNLLSTNEQAVSHESSSITFPTIPAPTDFHHNIDFLKDFEADTWCWVEKRRPGWLIELLALLPFRVLNHARYAPAEYRPLVFFPMPFFVKTAQDEVNVRAELATVDRDLAEHSVLVLPPSHDFLELILPPAWLIARLLEERSRGAINEDQWRRLGMARLHDF